MNKNKILVPLSNNSYEVIIKQGVINSIGAELTRIGINNDRKILIVSNKEISLSLIHISEPTRPY